MTVTQGQRLVESGPLPPVDVLMAALLNYIGEDGAGRPLVMVLDDYHQIQTQSIHRAAEFLVAHASPLLHLIVITREDPPLSLSRMRVRGQMTEVRAADLRFRLEEAADFLHVTMELNLVPEDAAALEQRTEGWLAGCNWRR